ncbi:spindle and centriole-associated protein 1 [Protopterus annectens]|uniref:spindle and centriole-associated protein 1 n=1 Tax=Protopterus annectens TaxID=7888 RepID=UPI001CFC1CA9|nr:spindle and centriole-associated protein 1 [Protopterus annectens]
MRVGFCTAALLKCVKILFSECVFLFLSLQSTVSDLSVHRATPEEIVRRHEMHKSRNRGLAQWELQERALRKKFRNHNKGSLDPLEKKKLAIMREVLSDHYQLKDVLERSDRAMAVVKDLFGDAPRRRTGIPNVTVAPDCDPDTSQQPIIQKLEAPTQLSLLSESVMNSQALNEVEVGEAYDSETEDSEVEDTSITFQSNIDTNRFHHLLHEGESLSQYQQWKGQHEVAGHQAEIVVNPPSTPHMSSGPLCVEQTGVLNATAAVQRVKSRLETEGESQTVNGISAEVTHVIGQVLNPEVQKPRKSCRKGKKSLIADGLAKQKNRHETTSDRANLSGNQSSMDVLHDMIQGVEKEMEDYERQTGRHMNDWQAQKSQGLTGFTMSLVGTLRRLVRYLKEIDLQLTEEREQRRQLEKQQEEQQVLIDVLTAEVMSFRNLNVTIQEKLQQYMVITDEALISLSQSTKEMPSKNSSREQIKTDCTMDATQHGAGSQELRNVNAEPDREEKSPSNQVDDRNLQKQSEQLNLTKTHWNRNIPEHLFQPAVLLSPPRQKSRQGLTSPCQAASPDEGALDNCPQFRGTQYSTVSRTSSEIDRQESMDTPASMQGTPTESHPKIQQWRGVQAERDLEPPSHETSFASLPQPDFIYEVNKDRGIPASYISWEPMRKETDGNQSTNLLQKQESLLAQISRLTLQNSSIKAELQQFKTSVQGQERRPKQTVSNQHAAETTAEKVSNGIVSETKSISSPSALEERIAELNRQSAEARNKLLQLIEQQKLITISGASPPISPITPQGNWSGTRGPALEVSIPLPEAVESSADGSPSSSSCMNNGRRSSGAASRTGSPFFSSVAEGRLTPYGQKAKIEKQNEEGWFALSTHVK